MRSLWLGVVMVACLVGRAMALDLGEARSTKDLEMARIKVQQFIDERNKRKTEGRLWVGGLAFCVCEGDRSKIIYATSVYLSRDHDGSVVAACREQAERNCGGCVKAPAFDPIDPQ